MTKHRALYYVLLWLAGWLPRHGVAQNVGINATGAVPNSSAMLDISSTNKGLLIPRLSLSATNSNAPVGAAIATSLLVYNTAYNGIGVYAVSPGYYYWDGFGWVALESGKSWSLQGNAGTMDGVSFLGTSDDVPLNFRVNNQKAGRIDRVKQNTFFGYTAGNGNSYGTTNCAVGDSALYNNDGNENTALGKSALHKNTSGYANTALGKNALYRNVSGGENTSIGAYALYSNATGSGNTASGYKALYRNTAGIYNTAFGWNNQFNNTSGNFNTSLGATILSANTTGTYNTGIGFFVLTASTGSCNTSVGSFSMRLSTSGNRNTAIGDSALALLTTGSNNTGLGYSANVPLAAGNNQLRVGNTAITYAGVQVAWSITSDRSWKTDIRASDLGLAFIRALRPVCYQRKNDPGRKQEYGFIAQEVQEQLDKFSASGSGIITKDDEGLLSLRYNDLLAPMVKAIQEQQEQIELLKAQNQELGSRLKKLEGK